jgi:hypothetical protein
MAATDRGYAGGYYMVTLDGGGQPGYVKKCDIGKLTGNLATTKLGPTLIEKKQITGMKWEPMTFEVGLSHANAFSEWMQAAFKGEHIRKNGQVTMYSHNGKAMRTVDFIDAHLTEISLPALDAKGKDSIHVTLKLQPEQLRFSEGGPAAKPTVGTKQKLHNATNFRLTIPGINCKSISKLELPKFTLKLVEHAVGEHIESTYEPASCEVSDLKTHHSAHEFAAIYKDAYAWLVQGARTEEAEKTISVELLGPDAKEPITTFEFRNCGYKELISANPLEAKKEEIATTQVAWYLEQIHMTINAKDL